MSDEKTASTTVLQNTMKNNASIMQLRLDTTAILNEISAFLSGKRVDYFRDEKGNITEKTVKMAPERANEAGRTALMSRLQLIFNPSTVQGNLDMERYQREISMIRLSLGKNMMLNLEAWGIKEDDYEEIIDSLMTPIKMFLSRAIDNEERKSYSESLKSSEVFGDKDPKKSRIPFIG